MPVPTWFLNETQADGRPAKHKGNLRVAAIIRSSVAGSEKIAADLVSMKANSKPDADTGSVSAGKDERSGDEPAGRAIFSMPASPAGSRCF